MKVSFYRTPFNRFQTDYSDNTAAYLSRLSPIVATCQGWAMPREEMPFTLADWNGAYTDEWNSFNYAVIDYTDDSDCYIKPRKWFYFAEYNPDGADATNQGIPFRLYIDWWGMYVNLSDETPLKLCKGLLRRSHLIYSNSLNDRKIANDSGLVNKPTGIHSMKGISTFGGNALDGRFGYGYSIIMRYKVQNSVISVLTESKYLFAVVTPSGDHPTPYTSITYERRRNALIDLYQLAKIGTISYSLKDKPEDTKLTPHDDVVLECSGAWVVPDYIGNQLSSTNYSIDGTLSTKQGVIIVTADEPTIYDAKYGSVRIIVNDYYESRKISDYSSYWGNPQYNTLRMVGNMQANIEIGATGNFDSVSILEAMITLSNASVCFRVMSAGVYVDLTDSLSVNIQTTNNYLDDIKTIISGISGFSGSMSSIAIGVKTKSPAAIAGGISSLASQASSYIGYAPTRTKYGEGMNGIINMSIKTKIKDNTGYTDTEIYTMGIALMRFAPLNENEIDTEFNAFGYSGYVEISEIAERKAKAYCYYQVDDPKIGQSEQIPERAKQRICEILAKGVTIWSDRLKNRYCTTRTWK